MKERARGAQLIASDLSYQHGRNSARFGKADKTNKDSHYSFAAMPLILKHAWTSRLSGEWNDDDYDVLADGMLSVAS